MTTRLGVTAELEMLPGHERRRLRAGDTRHFRVLRTIRGGPFTILPKNEADRGA
ncbi:MAG: hypothetical protein M3507_10080 [Actinomycetota bacterium]|nr:hypothetical protein [Actinomycetota bacterium]